MPATYSFTASESIGVPEQITFTDTTTSPDVGLTERRVLLRLANGTWLDSSGNESPTVVYTSWNIADASITLSVLSRSTTIVTTIQWMTGSAITAEITQDAIAFDEFDYLFAYDLIGNETSDPAIVQDNNYYTNFIQFIVNLFNGENAALFGDVWSSQQQFNKNYVFEQNENDFF